MTVELLIGAGVMLVKMAVALGVALGLAAYMILLERKLLFHCLEGNLCFELFVEPLPQGGLSFF